MASIWSKQNLVSCPILENKTSTNLPTVSSRKSMQFWLAEWMTQVLSNYRAFTIIIHYTDTVGSNRKHIGQCTQTWGEQYSGLWFHRFRGNLDVKQFLAENINRTYQLSSNNDSFFRITNSWIFQNSMVLEKEKPEDRKKNLFLPVQYPTGRFYEPFLGDLDLIWQVDFVQIIA